MPHLVRGQKEAILSRAYMILIDRAWCHVLSDEEFEASHLVVLTPCQHYFCHQYARQKIAALATFQPIALV